MKKVKLHIKIYKIFAAAKDNKEEYRYQKWLKIKFRPWSLDLKKEWDLSYNSNT